MLSNAVDERPDTYRQARYLEMKRLAAAKILANIRRWVPFKSMVDFGCSTGVWLDVARNLGATKTLGIDGPWISKLDLVNPEIDLLNFDLESRVFLGDTFDLAISLEVAEHLSAHRARSFVEDICKSSKVVLFGAAIPFQGGRLHANEQFASYWAKIFKECGYRYIDAIRPRIWDDDNLPFWYRQNTILYVHGSEYHRISSVISVDHEETKGQYLDFIHPLLYLEKARRYRKAAGSDDPSLRKSLRIAARIPLKAWRAVFRGIAV